MMRERHPTNEPFICAAPPPRSHLAAAWVEDGPLLFARIVWFTPLIALASVVLMLIIPVTGFVALVVLTVLIKTWWIGGILAMLVILLAARRDARAARLGRMALALSLAFAALGFLIFR
ncbi:hypothetical protein KZC52_07375 [Microbacterium sp. kSW2-24]|uniref:hypothetical protein n=1 Tax=Microbacterium galbinum TaxID=2851646 RepID=UPI001FFCB020|nr:hypothetical protein [Microbacterium galbinum]MCK2022738.1 hypothetical protein [Microbacterium galbinum]